MHQINFTDEQMSILNLNEGKHIVLAPPGTGKTELLTSRVVKAVNEGIDPEQIISLTFTNRAALNMAERLPEKLAGSSVISGTIHNYCYRFLRANNLISPELSVLDRADSDELINEIKASIGGVNLIKNDEVIEYAMLMKAAALGIPENLLYPRIRPQTDNLSLERLALRYSDLKDADSVFDYNDLLLEALYNLSLQGSEFRFASFRWLQVDEVQDLNLIQWEIIKRISNPAGVIVLFGDPGQGIFSFMGAKPHLVTELTMDFRKHSLTQNFRSSDNLIRLFDDFRDTYLTFKKFRITGMRVNPSDQYNGAAVFETSYSSTAPGGFPEKLLEESSVIDNQGTTAVLVRKNNDADLIYSFLRSRKVDCFKVSGLDLFERAFMKDIVAWFGCLSSTHGIASWKRILKLFGGFKTLRASAGFVRQMRELSLNPGDILKEKDSSADLREFSEYFTKGRIVVFDTETTGLDTTSDDIIQIAAVEYVNGVRGRVFERYIKSDKVKHGESLISGITHEFLEENGTDLRTAVTGFLDFCGTAPLLAHNAGFDSEMLNLALRRTGLPEPGNRIIDLLQIARFMYPGLRSYKLSSLISAFGIQGKNSHNALDDIMATASLAENIASSAGSRLMQYDQFYRNNIRVFNLLDKNLGELFRKHSSPDSAYTDLRELTEEFLRLRESVTGDKLTDDEKTGLQKFYRFLDIKIGKGETGLLLKKHLHSFLKLKESDLLIGDERFVISTIHKAKGLEFDNVIIPECSSSSFRPNYYDRSGAASEDAKLLYVAMTRAKKNLILTSHSIRSLPGYISDILSHFHVMN